ncbi:MAG: FdtA/QdtA family cupin domain-containing protein [Bacteroides sp.]|nr:FdtA/QdtA family cupin domain-containing protein [Bacteroides sp.]MCM1379472.1 FdtA/QdtA family cupin domain-containing protein [Bacteroides sp.]MCM1445925.1 FdtA/QdtA family cupin domain-containing protein [Prevotella sp.]
MKAEIIQLPKITDIRGNLTFVEQGNQLPFPISRAYWIYDVPGGENRGEHAHKTLNQLIIALSGSFSVLLDDGNSREVVFLNHPYVGLVVPAGIWHHLYDFSSGAVALALASDIYKESDYIRDYDEFLKYKVSGSQKG